MGLASATDLTRAALRVGIALSAEESDRLFAFAEILHRWNQRINLTASETLDAILERQILDCLMIERVPWPEGIVSMADIGSGAGLPGLVLAIRHPTWQITSLERVGKKVTFQEEAARVVGLQNVTILRKDAADHAAGSGRAIHDAVVARAYADLPRTLPLAADLLRPGGVFRTYKGRKLREEQAAIPSEVRARFDTEVLERGYALPDSEVAGIIVQYRHL